MLFSSAPVTSIAILLLGRALLGGAESFIITAAVSWGLALVNPRSTGKVIAWVGSSMFAAFAIGAPAGSALYADYGFAAIAFATVLACCSLRRLTQLLQCTGHVFRLRKCLMLYGYQV